MPKGRSKKAHERQKNEERGSESLGKLLRPLGLHIFEMESDGNCLFRAFSFQICDDAERHMEFRQQCCDYMQDVEPEYFKPFMEDTSFTEYIEEMRKDGEWGSQLEIVSLCRAYKTHCMIFRPEGLHYNIEYEGAEGDTPVVLLSHENDEHFNAVRFSGSGQCNWRELQSLLNEPVTRQSKKDARSVRMASRRKPPSHKTDNASSPQVHKLVNI